MLNQMALLFTNAQKHPFSTSKSSTAVSQYSSTSIFSQFKHQIVKNTMLRQGKSIKNDDQLNTDRRRSFFIDNGDYFSFTQFYQISYFLQNSATRSLTITELPKILRLIFLNYV